MALKLRVGGPNGDPDAKIGVLEKAKNGRRPVSELLQSPRRPDSEEGAHEDSQVVSGGGDRVAFADLVDPAEPGAEGQKLGVGQAALDAMKSPDKSLVEAANQTAEDAGVTGTPTVFLNGTKIEGASPQQMVEKIQQAVNAG